MNKIWPAGIILLIFFSSCIGKFKSLTNPVKVEFYARQFVWTARLAGNDGELGEADYTLITDANPTGLITQKTMEQKLQVLEQEIALMNKTPTGLYGDEKEKQRKIKQLDAIKNLKNRITPQKLLAGNDDVTALEEVHLPVNHPIQAHFRSRDVIHGAYFPHFKLSMYCVPGMTNQLRFSIDVTTNEMRKKTQDPGFDYYLICNKICGAGHFNMKMKIVVEPMEDFKKWMGLQTKEAYAY